MTFPNKIATGLKNLRYRHSNGCLSKFNLKVRLRHNFYGKFFCSLVHTINFWFFESFIKILRSKLDHLIIIQFLSGIKHKTFRKSKISERCNISKEHSNWSSSKYYTILIWKIYFVSFLNKFKFFLFSSVNHIVEVYPWLNVWAPAFAALPENWGNPNPPPWL